MWNLTARHAARSAISVAAIVISATGLQAQIDYSKLDVRPARDIAVNTMGALWIVGSDPAAATGIQRVVGSAIATQPGTATRIAVDPSGNAWIVNESGDVYHWEKVGAAPETWVKSNLKAMDVGVGRGGTVWAVGSDHRILKLDNGSWTAISGAGDRIAVDPAGNPWVVNSNHDIWYWNGTAWAMIAGKAQDVSVAPDGTVFIVGEAQRPGGFQILRRAGNQWVEIPGAAGIAVAATRSTLSIAQLPGSQIVNVNIPVYTQPQQTATVNVPVVTQAVIIPTQTGPGLPVPGPETTRSAAVALPPTPAGEVRRLFFRGQGYESRMLKAIHYGMWGDREFLDGPPPVASGLTTLERAFAHLAMVAAEDYYSKQPQATPDKALTEIGSETDPTARRAIAGIMGVLVIAKMNDATPDEETLALRDWGTRLWRNHKVVAAKTTLDEYLKWKQDPCGYEGKQPSECKTMLDLFTTRTPPENLFANRAAEAIFAKGAPELVAAAGIITSAVGGAIAGAVVASAIGMETSAGAATFYSLMPTFGGSLVNGASLVGVGSAGLIGTFVAAGVMAAVVGTTEGYKVVTAMRVEPMLRAKVGAAMTQPIVIENEIDGETSRNFFYIAAVNSALNRFVIPPTNVDGEIRYYNQGGYVGRMIVSWRLNNRLAADTTAGIPVGGEETIVVPAAATGITAKAEWSDLGITWRNFWTQTLPAPTYIGYTSYGTVFSPQVKEGYPEIENIKGTQNTLTLTHGGGYVARINMSWTRGGKVVSKYTSADVSAGWHEEVSIPADATNIYIEMYSITGWVGEPYKLIFTKTWKSPPNECVKIYGTTLAPLWNGECR